MTATSGSRAASAATIVCLAPIRAISEPARKGRVTNGTLPMPRTSPSFVTDPVVTRTNQGSASTVIDEPTGDTHSAATIARIGVEPTRLFTTGPRYDSRAGFLGDDTLTPSAINTADHVDLQRRRNKPQPRSGQPERDASWIRQSLTSSRI